MKSAALSYADSIRIRWIFYSFWCIYLLHHSTLPPSKFIAPPFFLAFFTLLLLFFSFFFCKSVCNFLSACLSGSSHSWISLCLGLWAGFWQGLLSLSLPEASKAKERDRLCHIMRALLPWLWLRVVIQNWCGEEPALTSCQQRMFSTGRQASHNDNVGYARRALTTPLKLWHTWYLFLCLQLS